MEFSSEADKVMKLKTNKVPKKKKQKYKNKKKESGLCLN